MAQLLVSVRTLEEAQAVLAGEAALIDIKEPHHGALGRADQTVMESILRGVAGRRPVSAALGELLQAPTPFRNAGLNYAKWGLAGCGGVANWRSRILTARQSLSESAPGCELVAVAYADWQRAEAPQPAQIATFAIQYCCTALLVDTWHKDGSTLLDWLPYDQIEELCRRCRAGRVRVALAGSLGLAEMHRLRSLEPEWFAVRSAVCRDGDRRQPIDSLAVRDFVTFLAQQSRRPGPKVDNLHA
jgi:uncharacterized protein (UPF0264 family)